MSNQSAQALSVAESNALPNQSKNLSSTVDRASLDWNEIDTVILDMDGTILDLHFDNRVWDELVPERFAQSLGCSTEFARNKIRDEMARVRGTIQYYSFDYWDTFTGLNLVDIHSEVTELVTYRPGAADFLQWLRDTGRQSIIATNAHRSSLLVKSTVIDLEADVDVIVSSHDYGAPKESPKFWDALRAATNYDPARSMFVDDNEPVLDAAAKADIAHVLAIATPDSTRPTRYDLSYPNFDDFREIYEHTD